MSIEVESIDDIAKRIGLSVEETRNRLEQMAKRGFIWSSVQGGYVRLALFIVGIYEEQLWDMDWSNLEPLVYSKNSSWVEGWICPPFDQVLQKISHLKTDSTFTP